MESVREQIFSSDYMKELMKTKQTVKLNLIRVLRGEISRLEDSTKKLTDAEVISLCKKMIENLKVIGTKESQDEIEILSEYVPQQISQDELQKIVAEFIATNNLKDMKSMGVVMSHLKELYSGKYDGTTANKIVREELSKNV